MFNSKVFLAEFVGAFALAFIGMSAGIVNAGLVGIALAVGLTQAALHLAYGRISGAHFNPAITFGAALNGDVKWLAAVFYWIAQFAGAILAAFFLKTILEPLGATIEGGVTVGALNKSQPVMAMVVEAI
ncbi:MAG: aquaporin, partial [Chloroflexi bacterium]|nr:aquaporin [Chloroflexota bacterium]